MHIFTEKNAIISKKLISSPMRNFDALISCEKCCTHMSKFEKTLKQGQKDKELWRTLNLFKVDKE